MSTVENRVEVLRRDCLKCNGRGYINGSSGEEVCPEGEGCGGSGLIAKEVAFKFDGKRSREEIANEFGIPVEQLKDDGHAEANAGQGTGD